MANARLLTINVDLHRSPLRLLARSSEKENFSAGGFIK
jgi:hypothetical protein